VHLPYPVDEDLLVDGAEGFLEGHPPDGRVAVVLVQALLEPEHVDPALCHLLEGVLKSNIFVYIYIIIRICAGSISLYLSKHDIYCINYCRSGVPVEILGEFYNVQFLLLGPLIGEIDGDADVAVGRVRDQLARRRQHTCNCKNKS
jgi:hypothetical protein